MTRLERDAPPNEAPQLTAPAFGDCWLAWELAPSLLSARDRGQRGSHQEPWYPYSTRSFRKGASSCVLANRRTRGARAAGNIPTFKD